MYGSRCIGDEEGLTLEVPLQDSKSRLYILQNYFRRLCKNDQRGVA